MESHLDMKGLSLQEALQNRFVACPDTSGACPDTSGVCPHTPVGDTKDERYFARLLP